MDNQSLNLTVQNMEKKLNDEKTKNNELGGQLKSSKTSYNFLKQEFEDYKAKAAKTLQSKERLIATLKESAVSTSSNSSGDGNNEANSLKSIEIDELKAERDSLKDELISKSATIELLKSEMMELESQTSIEIETLKDQIRTLEDREEESKQSKDLVEQDLKNLRQQLDYAQDELYKQKSNLNNRLQEREVEIEKLRNQVKHFYFNKKKSFESYSEFFFSKVDY
jgi:hypothetical protein